LQGGKNANFGKTGFIKKFVLKVSEKTTPRSGSTIFYTALKNNPARLQLHPAFQSPKNTASQSKPFIKKNKKPTTPNRRSHAFQSFFSMFSQCFDAFSAD